MATSKIVAAIISRLILNISQTLSLRGEGEREKEDREKGEEG